MEVSELEQKRKGYFALAKEINGPTSEEFKEIEELVVKGFLSYDIAERKLKELHKDAKTKEELRERESDITDLRIAKLLEEPYELITEYDAKTRGKIMSPKNLKVIHKKILDGFDDYVPGMMRCEAEEAKKVNLHKPEHIFEIRKQDGTVEHDTVKYKNYFDIESTLEFDFKDETFVRYKNLSNAEIIDNIADFTSRIWQVHPFREGNTRTTLLFMIKYLQARFGSEAFQMHFDKVKNSGLYFREALARSNYYNEDYGVRGDKTFLVKYFENLVAGKSNSLKREDIPIVMDEATHTYQKKKDLDKEDI